MSTSEPLNSTVILVANPHGSAGYQFDSWSGDACSGSTAPTCAVTMDDDRNVTATFTLKQFKLTVTNTAPSGGGKVTFQALAAYGGEGHWLPEPEGGVKLD